MKNLILSFLVIPIAFMCTSFLAYDAEVQNLVGSKWISPINDTCFTSLCFVSENKVVCQICKNDVSFEIDYKILEGKIEIEAYETGGDFNTKMILMEEDGVLKQLPSQKNNFPRNFLKVPEGSCGE
jgi:hypothetical protein